MEKFMVYWSVNMRNPKYFKRVCWLVIAGTIAFGCSVVKSQDFSDLFERVKSSVVVIVTTGSASGLPGTVATLQPTGLGSGFLIEDNKVLTAAHVIQNAESVKVRFHGGQEVSAKVLSSSQQADVALLKLSRTPLGSRPAVLGNSDDTKIGEQIIVVGAPYGLAYTLTAGHISNRVDPGEVGSGFSATEFFQTDASINQGNSGGPMFNMKGEVIGVVSHILSKSGGFEGLGFAATSSAARKVLLESEHVWTGVEAKLLTEPLSTLLNVPQPMAILVKKVSKGTIGERLGLKPSHIPVTIGKTKLLLGGDIILEVMGIRVDSIASLDTIRKKVGTIKKGEVFRLTVWRKGKTSELRCTW
jgi:serine protease Do